jgi:hypothetical protein
VNPLEQILRPQLEAYLCIFPKLEHQDNVSLAATQLLFLCVARSYHRRWPSQIECWRTCFNLLKVSCGHDFICMLLQQLPCRFCKCGRGSDAENGYRHTSLLERRKRYQGNYGLVAEGAPGDAQRSACKPIFCRITRLTPPPPANRAFQKAGSRAMNTVQLVGEAFQRRAVRMDRP